MNDEKEKRIKRISFIKRLLVVLLVILIIFPTISCVIMMVKQSEMQRQIDNLTRELVNMRLDSFSDLGRIANTRLVNLEDYSDDFNTYDPFGINVQIASTLDDEPDIPKQEDVVWKFASDGELLHRVYLTFDDGPSIYTNDILDILDEYGIKATFFVIGHEEEEYTPLYQRIVDDGHTLGMHSYNHVYSQVYESTDAFTADLYKLEALLVNRTGTIPSFYRFPGGSSNTVSRIGMQNFIDVLDEKGITYFDWNVSSGDASGDPISVDQIVSNATYGIENRDETVILLHDTGAKHNTVLALPAIIEKIQGMENTLILPITAETEPVQHIN